MYTEYIEYQHEDTLLEAYVATEDSKKKRPLILICHAWRGRDEFVIEEAQEYAKKGYCAVALDVYGKGVLGDTVEENTKLMQPFMEDRKFLQERLLCGVHMAKELAYSDEAKVVILGFCFGGLCALDVARSGEPISGVISFHGLLFPADIPNPAKVETKALILNGDIDPLVSEEDIQAFQKEFSDKGIDWQLINFSHTYHAFTNPIANDPSSGVVYNPIVAKRAFRYAEQFIAECFR